MKTRHATVHFNEQGTPVADDFDDVYFSNDSGIDETLHVFVGGNNLSERWLHHTQPHFVIAETGFGTGLNCLVAMQAFARFRQQHPDHPLKRLFILTTECFLLKHADLERALAHFPGLAAGARELLRQYPLGLDGCHRLHFTDFSTTLDIWLGDVHELLPQWHAPGEKPEQGLVDAWFLDGFAPSKNPQMWTEALFGQMARLSKPGTTFATFTAAGIVKRGLAAQGFVVTKCRGFGRKRDMLTGTWSPAETEAGAETQKRPYAGVTDAPYYRYTTEPLTAADDVAVVGAGLAGALTALALVRRGIRVNLITQANDPADGASGNPQGGFYPQLHAVRSPASELQAHSFIYARRYYDWLLNQGGSFAHQWCGVLLLDFNDKVAARHQLMQEEQTWPQELIHGVDAPSASTLAGVNLPYPALFCAPGGWISPPQLVESLITQARQTGLLTFQPNTRVTGFRHHPDRVTLTTGNTETDYSQVVFASGESPALALEQFLPLRPVRGQVEAVKSVAPLNQLQTVLCHKGYLTPALDGYHAMGSTYVKNDTATETREQESQQNEQLHQRVLGTTEWGACLRASGKARAAIRQTLPDHQPAAGNLPLTAETCERWLALGKGIGLARVPTPPVQRVQILTGLGSRGLTTAPLMAEILASQLTGEPLPLSNTLLQTVNPQRFIVRQCIRSEVSGATATTQ